MVTAHLYIIYYTAVYHNDESGSLLICLTSKDIGTGIILSNIVSAGRRNM